MKKYRFDPLLLHIKKFVVLYVVLDLSIYLPSYYYIMRIAKHEKFSPPVEFLICLFPCLQFFIVFGFKFAIFFAENRAGEKLLQEKDKVGLKNAALTSFEE